MDKYSRFVLHALWELNYSRSSCGFDKHEPYDWGLKLPYSWWSGEVASNDEENNACGVEGFEGTTQLPGVDPAPSSIASFTPSNFTPSHHILPPFSFSFLFLLSSSSHDLSSSMDGLRDLSSHLNWQQRYYYKTPKPSSSSTTWNEKTMLWPRPLIRVYSYLFVK